VGAAVLPSGTTWPGDAGYPSARRRLSVSGVLPGDRPATVVPAGRPEDVVAALRHAHREGRQVTVCSGGHGTSFTALADGAVALDLSGLDHVAVDRAARTARVGPGTTSLALAESLDGTGLAFPVGHKASVGLGGFLLAGGNGWNQGVWGSGCESVLGADVVLADGSLVAIDAATDPEAFAVLRGAGPAFPGVVTSLLVRLWREPVVARRSVRFEVRDASGLAEAGEWADAVARAAPPQVEQTLVLEPGGDGVLLTAGLTAFGLDRQHAERLLDSTGPPPPGGSAVVATAPSVPDLLRSEPARPGRGCVAQQAWSRAGYAQVLPRLASGLREAPSGESSVLVSSASYRRAAPPSNETLHRPLGTLTVAAYAVGPPRAADPRNQWV
jgi:FAD/FMN-containing dehydrogenase